MRAPPRFPTKYKNELEKIIEMIPDTWCKIDAPTSGILNLTITGPSFGGRGVHEQL